MNVRNEIIDEQRWQTDTSPTRALGGVVVA